MYCVISVCDCCVVVGGGCECQDGGVAVRRSTDIGLTLVLCSPRPRDAVSTAE